MTTNDGRPVDGGERNVFDSGGDDLTVFASTLAHDLRTPLMVARGHLELMEGDRERADSIASALDDAEKILDEMLELATDGGQISPLVRVPLGVAAHTAWDQVPAGEARLEVRSNRPIAADPSTFDRILVNLFKNAIEHGSTDDTRYSTPSMEGTPGETADRAIERARAEGHADLTVTVGALSDGFYVEDNGDGLDESMEGSLFETGESTDTEGTGIGLAIVERFAAAHDWTVEQTTGMDGGVRFEFRDVNPDF